MDVDNDMFVQAFWAKCREVIRPELDRALGRLRHLGHEAEISSQEMDVSGEGRPAAANPAPPAAPSLSLASAGAVLSFHGDVARQTVGVDAAESLEHNMPTPELDYALDELDAAEVASIVAAWEASLGQPVAKATAA